MIIRLPKECFGTGEDFPKVEIVYEYVNIFGRYYLIPVVYEFGEAPR